MVYNSAMGISVILSPSKKELHERLQTLFQHAQSCDTDARSLLFVGPTTLHDYQDLRTSYASYVAASGGTLVELSCAYTLLTSFWPLRSLLDKLVPLVATEAPEVVQRYSAELTAIYPELLSNLGFQPAKPIEQIALTPSERRSHRESEQTYRIITGVCQFLFAAQQAAPSLARGPVVLWWNHLHLADRPTLLAFRRLNHWINQAHAPIVLVATLDPASGPSLDNPAVASDLECYLDWTAEHRTLVATVRSQLLGTEVAVQASDSHADVQPASQQVNPSSDEALNEAVATAQAMRAFTQGHVEEGCAYAIQAIRLAFFALNLEGILFLSRQIIARLHDTDEASFDTDRFAEVWQHLTETNAYAALEFSLVGIRRRRDILIATWKAVALAQTFLEHHEVAITCYQRALDLADTAPVRASLYMYLGLLTGKRLRKIPEAQAYLKQGLAEINGLKDDEAALERGWLYNVSALMLYQLKSFDEALTTVRRAIQVMAPLHSSEATHLKINLISNISYLLEDMKRMEETLSTWSIFHRYMGSANDLFAKHFYFREAGLRVKAGDLPGALASYRESYAQSQHTVDSFYMDVVARGCGRVTYLMGNFDEAATWYQQSAKHREDIGDYNNLPESLLAQALSSFRAGQREVAQELVERADKLCRMFSLEWNDALAAAQACLADDSTLAAWEKAVIVPVGTKLNRPFSLINLYQGGVWS